MKKKWFLDSGCSKHMTGNIDWFTCLTKKNGGKVTFGGNEKGKIIGIGNIGNPLHVVIENVCLVEGLNHNLLSISQLCDKGYEVIFVPTHCHIKDPSFHFMTASIFKHDLASVSGQLVFSNIT